MHDGSARRATGSPCRGALVFVALVSAFAAVPGRAAQVTEFAQSGDDGQSVDVQLGANFLHSRRSTRLTRESRQADPNTFAVSIADVDELRHVETVDEVQARLGIGLFHHFELHILAPFVLRDRQTYSFVSGNGASSTLLSNRIDISGCAGSFTACDPSGPAKPIVAVPLETMRSGFRDPTVGIAWVPIDEDRESRLRAEQFPPLPAASTWALGIDYTLPLPGGDVDDPSRFGPSSAPASPTSGAVARKAHVFSVWTALSRRYEVLDPYLRLQASASFAKKGSSGDGAYDNCWHPELLSDVAVQNCADPAWRNETGYRPPITAQLTVGTEIVASESVRRDRKLALDLRGDVFYVGSGRTYTQATDALGKLTRSEEYAGFQGSVALDGHVSRWLRLRLAGKVGLETPHFLTTESTGKDLNGDGNVDLSQGASPRSLEQNPNYDFRLDPAGRRLRAEAALTWGLEGLLTLAF